MLEKRGKKGKIEEANEKIKEMVEKQEENYREIKVLRKEIIIIISGMRPLGPIRPQSKWTSSCGKHR